MYYYLYNTNYLVVRKEIKTGIITNYSSKQPSFYEHFNTIKKYETSQHCYKARNKEVMNAVMQYSFSILSISVYSL